MNDFQKKTANHFHFLPEVLGAKGTTDCVGMPANAYQALLSKLDLYESAIAINRGLQDIAQGRFTTLANFDRRMRPKNDRSV